MPEPVDVIVRGKRSEVKALIAAWDERDAVADFPTAEPLIERLHAAVDPDARHEYEGGSDAQVMRGDAHPRDPALLHERARRIFDRLSALVGELAPRTRRVEDIAAAVRDGLALVYPAADIDRHVELAARAMARANDDGCFEEYDAAIANRDLMSKESFDDETGAGEEDRDYYRSLARAALEAPPSAAPAEEDGHELFDELRAWSRHALSEQSAEILGAKLDRMAADSERLPVLDGKEER